MARLEAGLQAPVVQVGDIAARREFLDVRDVVRAYLALIERANEPRLVVNIASSQAVAVAEVLAILKAQARRPFETRVDPARLRLSEVPVAVGDASLLTALTGWRPKHALADTVLSVLDDARRRLAA